MRSENSGPNPKEGKLITSLKNEFDTLNTDRRLITNETLPALNDLIDTKLNATTDEQSKAMLEEIKKI